MEYQSFSIRQLLEAVNGGAIRIPAFQRGFVWDMDRVAYLMDSIYKNYPFGSLLFWRTKNKLKVERKLGQFNLPEPKEDYPIDYVLDGQQRLTSIFSVFQNELKPNDFGVEWSEIYFDLEAANDAQDSQFVALNTSEVDSSRHFPLNVLFDSVKYRTATEGKSPEQIKILDRLQEKFKEVSIPVQVLKTEDRSIVAIVFERVNRLGMELDTLQLLSAWTWNEEFDLLAKFKELGEELQEFGFSEIGEDSDLILRCSSAILLGDPTVDKLLDLNGQQVRDEFSLVRNGILGAIDFMRTQLCISSLKNLPYTAMIIPLTVFFAEPDGKEVSYDSETYKQLKVWFWKSCFTRRYSSQIKRTAIIDINHIKNLKHSKTLGLGEFKVEITSDIFTENTFRIGNANTKTFVLMLANNQPRSFISGASVDLDKVLQKYNRAEFHHIYPKAYLKELGVEESKINCLANFCFLNSTENKKIGRKKPSEYLSLMPSEELLSAIKLHAYCPDSTFLDNYDNFISDRVNLLVEKATRLITI